MKKFPKPFAIACVAWLIPMSLRAAVTFTDGTFNPADWSATQTVGNGSLATSQTAAGGNPGAYRRVEHNTFSGNFVGFHYRAGASYDPGSGAIDSIDFSIDEIAILNHANIGVGVMPALQQNGINYLPNFDIPTLGFLLNSTFAWQTLTMSGLEAADFRTWSNVNAHPDFSVSGAPILMGFATGNDNGGATLSRAAGFDNWSVTVNPIPEPSSAILLGLAGLGLLRRPRTV